jgi:hypothetical protein
VVVSVSVGTILVGCSDSRPPPADTTATRDGGLQYVDGSAVAVTTDGAAADPSDASVDALVDAEPGWKCLGDELVDGGNGIVCPSTGSCSSACGHIVDRYKAGVAQAALKCILALPSCGAAADVIACVDKALSSACSDTTSAGFCSPLVLACDPAAGDNGSAISQEGCELFANGLSGAGRTFFQSCIQDKITAGTCPTDIVGCANDVRY